MNRKPFRIRLWVVLAALAAGLVLVPAGLAAVDPSALRDLSDPFGKTARTVAPSGYGLPDSWQLRASDPYNVAAPVDPSALRDGTDRLGPTARTATPTDYGRPDSWQLRPTDPYGIGSIASPTVGSGFQWGDAGIGGAVGFGVALALLALSVSLLRRNRRPSEPGTPALA